MVKEGPSGQSLRLDYIGPLCRLSLDRHGDPRSSFVLESGEDEAFPSC